MIVAGYTAPMNRFLASNPGLRSRFSKFIHFADYTAGELQEIFIQMLRRAEYTITTDAMEAAREQLQQLHEKRDKHFGNGRLVRNIVELIQQAQADRLAAVADPDREQLMTLTREDVMTAMDRLPPAPGESNGHRDS